MVSYAFPPMGGSAVQRTQKFAKYLPSFYWKPLIIAANTNTCEKDPNLLGELPDAVTIYRAFYPQLLKSGHGTGVKRSGLDGRAGFKKQLASVIRSAICVPDDRILWMPFALKQSLRAMKENKADIIYTTSNPYTAHLVGYLLKKITRKPWVADFRDPWTDNIYHSARYYGSLFGQIRKKIDRYLEKIVIKTADRVIGTTQEMADLFAQRYGGTAQDKYAAITNGYDAEDFVPKGAELKKKPGPFNICYCGSFRRVSPENFLNALRKVLDQHPEMAGDLRVSFVGQVQNEIVAQIDRLDLARNVELIGYKTHQEAISYLLSADLLLLLLTADQREKLIMPGKIFEYLAAQKPVLALLPDGPAADLINRHKAGKVIHPDAVEEIENALVEYYRQYKNGRLSVPNNNVEIYDRKYLTKKLADIFEAALI